MSRIENPFSVYLNVPKKRNPLRDKALTNVLKDYLSKDNLNRATDIAREIRVPTLIS